MATLLQQLIVLYDTTFPTGPVLWEGVQPEGTIRTTGFPQVVLQHLSEIPQYHQGSDGQLTLAHIDGIFKFIVYGDGPKQAEDQVVLIRAALEAGPITVGLDTDVRLMEIMYNCNPTIMRAPSGSFVFMAQTTYKARYNSTGGGSR